MAVAEKKVGSGESNKYLTFILKKDGATKNDEEYGVPVTEVREIIGIMPITAIPQSPPSMKGVINLRGKVIPITDLRTKFDMPERNHDEHTCIIVVEVNEKQVGMIVDVVSEVANINSSEIQNPQGFGNNTSNFVSGLAKQPQSEKVIILLNINEIFPISQLEEAIWIS